MVLVDYRKELDLLGVTDEKEINLKELKKAFKKKSLAMLPEKHPTIANAHSQFEEIIEAFVQVLMLPSSIPSLL